MCVATLSKPTILTMLVSTNLKYGVSGNKEIGGIMLDLEYLASIRVQASSAFLISTTCCVAEIVFWKRHGRTIRSKSSSSSATERLFMDISVRSYALIF
jgi:hypothetical protein